MKLDHSKDRIERGFRLLELMLDQTNVYHNHKETMANAGIVAQLTVAAGVISMAKPPAEYILPIQVGIAYVSPKVIAILSFGAIWLLTNVFIRWQMRNRRWAAIFGAALEETVRKWAVSDPTPADLHPFTEPSPHHRNKFRYFVDMFLFPVRSATLYSDVSRGGWPNALGEEWLRKAKDYPNEPIHGEWLLSLGSILALAVGLARLFAL